LTARRYLLAEQTIDERDLGDLIGWLQTNPWLSQQQLVAEFERQWASWLGVRHAVFVNSGSSANLLMFWTLLVSGRLRNRKVIVPAVCWPTTAAPAIQLGFEPILCEAEPRTLGLDPNHLEALLREHGPAAVALVHVLGVPSEMDAIADLKGRFPFLLIEDACAAIGSQFDGQRVGTFGDLSSFSFFYGHQLSTIEGGMICTSDDGLDEILRQVRSHGWAKDLPAATAARLADERGTPAFNRPFTFHEAGFNVRSTRLASPPQVIGSRIRPTAAPRSRASPSPSSPPPPPRATRRVSGSVLHRLKRVRSAPATCRGSRCGRIDTG
jgi:CDP-6-deoxy-D-xylo-4-hexulose-3-dehydrase